MSIFKVIVRLFLSSFISTVVVSAIISTSSNTAPSSDNEIVPRFKSLLMVLFLKWMVLKEMNT